MVTLIARSPCLLCGCYLSSYAFPSVRVNRRSLKQLPGTNLICHPGACPECQTGAHGSPPAPYAGEMFTASPWRLDAKSLAEVEAYRAKRWPGVLPGAVDTSQRVADLGDVLAGELGGPADRGRPEFPPPLWRKVSRLVDARVDLAEQPVVGAVVVGAGFRDRSEAFRWVHGDHDAVILSARQLCGASVRTDLTVSRAGRSVSGMSYQDLTAAELATELVMSAATNQNTGLLSMLDEATFAFRGKSPEIDAAQRAFAMARLDHMGSYRSALGDYSPKAWDKAAAAARNLAALLRPLGATRIARCKRMTGWGTCNLPLDSDGVCRYSEHTER